MPRASWSGLLRLSLVSCLVYLSPATTRTKSLRLHQVWRPAAADEPGPEESDRERDEQLASGSRPQLVDPRATERANQATRIALRPHDPRTGEEIEKSEVVKGYEYDRGQFVTFTAEELKALDVESSQVVDLESFVPRGDIDAVDFDSAYYLYPDGAMGQRHSQLASRHHSALDLSQAISGEGAKRVEDQIVPAESPVIFEQPLPRPRSR